MPSSLSTFPPEPASARAARRFVVNALHAAGHEAHAEIAEVLVSELVTNAVLHARTEITVAVKATEAVVRISVSDGSSATARRRDFADDATTGRGLGLVAALASAWGSGPSNGGKTVWFELRESVMAT